MKFEDMKSPEFQSKLQEVKSVEELVSLAKEEGVELTDQQIERISGGGVWNHPSKCPRCGSEHIYHYAARYYCRDCRYEWDDGGW